MFKQSLIVLALLCPTLATAQITWPPENSGGWVLAHVDVETTGLDPAFHEMIDIGMIYTDLGLPDETRVPSEHTGITGAAFNVLVYRALIARQGNAAE